MLHCIAEKHQLAWLQMQNRPSDKVTLSHKHSTQARNKLTVKFREKKERKTYCFVLSFQVLKLKLQKTCQVFNVNFNKETKNRMVLSNSIRVVLLKKKKKKKKFLNKTQRKRQQQKFKNSWCYSINVGTGKVLNLAPFVHGLSECSQRLCHGPFGCCTILSEDNSVHELVGSIVSDTLLLHVAVSTCWGIKAISVHELLPTPSPQEAKSAAISDTHLFPVAVSLTHTFSL